MGARRGLAVARDSARTRLQAYLRRARSVQEAVLDVIAAAEASPAAGRLLPLDGAARAAAI